jgi:hypothetical protein
MQPVNYVFGDGQAVENDAMLGVALPGVRENRWMKARGPGGVPARC